MKKLFVAGLISQVLLLLSQPVAADQVPYPGSAGAASSYGSSGTPSAPLPNYNAAPAPYYPTSSYGTAPAGYADGSSSAYTPGAPVAYYGFGTTNGYQPGTPAGFTSGPPTQYANGAAGYGNSAPAGYANGTPTGYANGTPTGYTNGTPTGYTNGAPSGYTNGAPSGYTNGAPSRYGNASPAGYGNGSPASFGTSAGAMPNQPAGPQPFLPTASAGVPATPVPGQSLSQQAGQYPQYPQAGMIPPQPGQGQPVPATLSQQQNGMQQYGLPAQSMLTSQSAAVRGMVTPPSAIENALTQDPVPADKTLPQQFNVGPLTQFGYSFFRPDAAGFAPIGDVPVGPDYQVGPGDHLTVTLWGSIEGTFDLEVNRSGELVLPKVGVVQVTGETLGQLPGLLKSQLGRVFKDFHINVNMGKLRMMKVYVVGQVTAPGDYNLTSLSTLINALSAAGGPTKDGSLRNVQIKRNGRLVESVDLYDFFLKGDKSKDIRLQPGDTIFVPVIGPVAGLAGNVRRPAIYELKGEKTLRELIRLADGINPTGYLQRVQISRVQSHSKREITDFDLDPKNGRSSDERTGAIAIRDLDVVKIFPIDQTLRGYVRLEGYVLRPGDYALEPGMRLSALLAKENLLPEYYMPAGQITRLTAPDNHPEVFFVDLSRALRGEQGSDPELKEFDRVHIFSRWEMEEMPSVRISGEVQRPGAYRLFEKMTVRDLLMQAGNVKLTAYLKNAEITRLKRTRESVSSYSISIDLSEALKGGKDNVKLEPFDELYVRRIPNWGEETDRYITLKGEFVFPGVYPIYKGERLSSVIKRAGGYTDKAYLPAAKFTRSLVRELQQKRMDEVLSSAEIDVTKKQSELASSATSPEELAANKSALEAVMKSIQLLKAAKSEGRLVMKLSPPEQMKGGAYDLEAMGGDLLEVPADPHMVSVLGQVYTPTSFVYQPGETVGEYLKHAGGMTAQAEQDELYIIKADGSVISGRTSGGFLGIGGIQSKQLASGDTVVVPQRTEHSAWMREIKDIATILGQFAITAGVVIAAGL